MSVIAGRLRTTIPVGGDMTLGIDRLTMRRRVMAALLRHAPDGLGGACYCGDRYERGSEHRVRRVAAETGLAEDFVRRILAVHSTAVGNFGHAMRCACGDVYDDSFAAYGREQHLAEAIAANCGYAVLAAAAASRRGQRAAVVVQPDSTPTS
jgi:hypothetical protein